MATKPSINRDIVIRGAKERNLKNIDVRLPRDSLTVMTGLSGSGKSSLAFDTIYAEGQRRYVESLSAYARQFLRMMQKPDVEHIEGPLAGHLHRAEDHLAQPALDGRHRHRDLRLPAPALRRASASLFAGHGPAHRARPSARWSTVMALPRARGSTCSRPSPATARASTSAAQRADAQGFPAREDRRRLPRHRGCPGARQERSSTTSRSWSTASSSAPTSPPASPKASRPR